MTQQERLVNRALEYARRGWFVFPIDPRDKAPIPARDKDANGQPIDGTGGFYKSTRDNDQIVAWWDEHPAAMIGVRTGECSGIWVVDLDVPDPNNPKDVGKTNGVEVWPALVRKMGACPHTHTHTSPRGGRHLVFKWRPERPIGCPGTLKPFGADVKGNGGYIVAPPSSRVDGVEYDIEEPLDYFRFAEAPEWLYRLVDPPPKPRPRYASQSEPRFLSGRVQGLRNRLRNEPDGNRNQMLFWTACRLFEISNETNLPRDAVFEIAVEDGMHIGLPRSKVLTTVRSADRTIR